MPCSKGSISGKRSTGASSQSSEVISGNSFPYCARNQRAQRTLSSTLAPLGWWVPQLQVLGAVVVVDVVAVMHGLALAQGTPQHLGHHPDVLGDPARLRLGVGVVRVWAADEDVALGVHPAPFAPQGVATAGHAGAGWRAPGRGRPRDASWCSREGAALVLLTVATQ